MTPEEDLAFVELVRKAMEAFKRRTPEEQAAHRREQTIDWVYGEMCLGLNDDNESGVSPISREEIGRMYDERQAAKAAE